MAERGFPFEPISFVNGVLCPTLLDASLYTTIYNAAIKLSALSIPCSILLLVRQLLRLLPRKLNIRPFNLRSHYHPISTLIPLTPEQMHPYRSKRLPAYVTALHEPADLEPISLHASVLPQSSNIQARSLADAILLYDENSQSMVRSALLCEWWQPRMHYVLFFFEFGQRYRV